MIASKQDYILINNYNNVIIYIAVITGLVIIILQYGKLQPLSSKQLDS